MKRLLRIIFNSVALISLLLCVATAALWLRGLWVIDRFVWTLPTAQHTLSLGPDRLQFYTWRLCDPRDSYSPTGFAHLNPPRDYPFTMENSPMPDTTPIHVIRRGTSAGIASGHIVWRVPYDLPLSLGVVPIVWVLRRPRRVAPKDRCASCGYDLRATRERCPECGTSVASPGESAR